MERKHSLPALTISFFKSTVFRQLLFVCALLSLISFGFLYSGNPVHSSLSKTRQLSESHFSSGTATSGKLFSGDRIRSFSTSKKSQPNDAAANNQLLNFIKKRSPQYSLKCRNWAVMTTIFEVSDSVRNTVKKLPGWCMVVVGDSSGPKSYALEEDDSSANVYYLDAAEQQKLAEISPFINGLPWKHFGRKNVGYLWAVLHHAEAVWDFDDDNELILEQLPIPGVAQSSTSSELDGPHFVTTYEVVDDEVVPAVNPYPILGATTEAAWPRGFPLTLIKTAATRPGFNLTSVVANEDVAGRIGVVQSLANHDPDVDAIYRLTQPMPLNFEPPAAKEVNYLMIPKGRVTPYNAQATLHLKNALWGLLLPVTVHGRVSDIWRGYAIQRLMWDVDLQLAFAGPYVIQVRNAHNYLGDLQAENDLYMKTEKLIDFLVKWTSDKTDLADRIEELYIALYERSYFEENDVHLMQLWLQELKLNGYIFPELPK